MKKLLTIGTLCLACNNVGATAVLDTDFEIGGDLVVEEDKTTCSTTGFQTCISGTYASSCNTTACNNCKSSSESTNSVGIVTIISAGTYKTTCGTTTNTCSCTGKTTTYACAEGYYGTPTNNLTGCTACPLIGAECPYGDNDTFTCVFGYFKSSETTCSACPSFGTFTTCSGETLTCAKGYYRNGNTCTRCPSSGGVYGTTLLSGATDIGACYIPANSEFSDESGSGIYTGDCYYTK